ncbi:acetyl-CoA hydrolase/transferase family protein [Desulfoluna spongiiphila]|uniref:Probable butyrate:acetyl-CoA coenzyme A-transferase n=1 Tax=Desulfoluna spongiiphila TaxID=419481 RepID=A0A1G5AQ26_9BACT|nr:acetyl-CoA hydrolase/transferase C-terminal domain-containing protein [Desulfoluna spongiiphila]SCX79952.1 Acyl-CoA hydrolase [Desulfoluna spongiiphila]
MSERVEREYELKRTGAAEAMAGVKSGDRIFYGEFTLFPRLCDAALAAQKDGVTGVNVDSVCFTQMPKVAEVDPDGNHFILNDWHFGGVSRKLHKQGRCNYIPLTYHQGPRIMRKYQDYDIVVLTTGPMDERGYFNYGISNSMASAAVDKARRVVVEVNPNVPNCLGGNQESIHITRVDAVVEGRTDTLVQVPAANASDIDRSIAAHIMEVIEDGSCLQLGIGALPNVIGSMLADSDLKDLGVHTEMLVDSCVDLYECGKITGARKVIDKYKMAYTFAMGTQKLYDFLHNNPTCASYPVHYINDPKIVALNPKVVAVNNAVAIDLYSQVCSESAGTRQVSGTGGQLDFIFGAFGSKGGKGIIGISSTYTDSKGEVHSRINPTLAPGSIVTLPRSLVQYVATEYGMVQLKGKSTVERAQALISIAHPDFRDELANQAAAMGIG